MICDFKKGAGGKGRPRAAYLSSGLAVCQLSHATALSYSNQHMPLQLWANLHAKLLNPPPRTRQGRRSTPPAPRPIRARHAPAWDRGARRRGPGQRQHPGHASEPGASGEPEPRPGGTLPALSPLPIPSRTARPGGTGEGACGGGAATHTYLRRDYRPN